MAGKISDLLIGGDLIDQQLTEFLDPGLKTQNEIARRTSAMLTGVAPESPGAPTAQMAARLTAQGFENLRRGLAEQNPGRFANEAELFQQQVQGLNLNDPAGRAAAVAAARRINPARAMQLAQAFQAQDVASQQAIGNRFAVQNKTYSDGSIFNQTATGQQVLITPEGTFTDPREIAIRRRAIEENEAQTQAQQTVDAAQLLAEQEMVNNQITEALTKQNQVDDRLQVYNQILAVLDDENANPSALQSLFPSFLRSNATNQFYALTNALGLNVIAGTTFGALSESELRFALQTAVPVLDGRDAYEDYFMRKREVEQKLLNELINYQNYLQGEGRPTSLGAFRTMTERQADFTSRANPDQRIEIPEEYLNVASNPANTGILSSPEEQAAFDEYKASLPRRD